MTPTLWAAATLGFVYALVTDPRGRSLMGAIRDLLWPAASPVLLERPEPWPAGSRRLGDVVRDAYRAGLIDADVLEQLLGEAFARGQHERALACHNRPPLVEVLEALWPSRRVYDPYEIAAYPDGTATVQAYTVIKPAERIAIEAKCAPEALGRPRFPNPPDYTDAGWNREPRDPTNVERA